MTLVVKYQKGLGVDPMIPAYARKCQEKTIKKDNDLLILLTGVTGSGKSTLLYWILSHYVDNINIDFVALSKEKYAQALFQAKATKKPRYVAYDEALVIKRSSLTKWNKELVELQQQIRGKNICQFWCTPSVDMLDKHFLNEVADGLFFVYTKNTPRYYMYFQKEAIQEILEKHKNLSHNTLVKYGKRYAYYIGWFEKYDGDGWQEYLRLKNKSMDGAIEGFYNRWAKGELYSGAKSAELLGVARSTLYDWLKDRPEYEKNKTPTGNWRFSKEDLEAIGSAMRDE